MFRSLLCKYVESSSSTLAAKYSFLFTVQHQNVFVISNSRVTSIFYSLYTTTTTGQSKLTTSSDSSFVVCYLINSCGLSSESEAITASKKINFKTTTKPDSVLTLLRTYGFTESHISKLITKYPSILSSNPDKTLKPKFDFLKSKGLYGIELANFISKKALILKRGFKNEIIPSFDILKNIVQTDQNVIKVIKRNYRILSSCHVKRVIVNLEILRNQGVPQTNISNYLINQPRTFTVDADSFKEILDKVKDMGFDPSQITFLIAVRMFAAMTEASWRKKMDVYKKWGLSEDHIRSAFRKNPNCMAASEKKIMAVISFLVNEMGYDSPSIAEFSTVFCYSLKKRITPRCSVIRILVSRGLIKENVPISTISTMVDKTFLEKFVTRYEQEVPELMKIFQGQLHYQQLLQN